MNNNTTQTNKHEHPATEVNEQAITEMNDSELEKIAGGMLACNKLAPCV